MLDFGPSYRVLVIDDQSTHRTVTRKSLEQLGHRVTECGAPEQAAALFKVVKPDLVLLDVEMPGLDGYSVARQLRATEAGSWTPIIFLSSHHTDEDIWHGIHAGGDDYLAKPLSPQLLTAKLHAVHRLLQLRTKLLERSEQLREANERLQHVARHDALTGLLNRGGLDQALHEALKRCRAAGTPLSVMLIDVDHFKAYNDALGHLAGDTALRRVAQLLREACPKPGDLAARYGGEEFAMLLPGTPRSGAMTLARGLLRSIAQAALPHPASSVGPHLSFSGGITTLVPDDSSTAEGVLLCADEALYAAKSRGRNCFFSFEMQMDTEEQRELLRGG
jgi:diguanylate cyclase (GGDEF)-like protein